MSDVINGEVVAVVISLAPKSHHWHFTKGKPNLPLS